MHSVKIFDSTAFEMMSVSAHLACKLFYCELSMMLLNTKSQFIIWQEVLETQPGLFIFSAVSGL